MPLNSQQKGKRYERDIAAKLSTVFGCKVRRVPCSGGLDIKGDLRNLSGPLENYVWECKHQESLNIWNCLDQTMRQAGNKVGVLVFRRNRSQSYCALLLDDFLALLQELNDAKAAEDNSQ